MSHLMMAKTKRAGQVRPQPLVQEVVMEHHNDYVADLLMSLPPSGEEPSACAAETKRTLGISASTGVRAPASSMFWHL